MAQSLSRAAQAMALCAALVLVAFGPTGAQAQKATPVLDVPFVPTPEETVNRMLDMAKVGPSDFLIDLGSGDGRIPVAAAKRFGTRGLGIDIDPERIKDGNANAKAAGVTDKVEFREQNLFETDISQASVLTLYLFPEINRKLRPKILAEMKPGSRVVSHQFDMGDWKPEAETRSPSGSNRVFLWIVPEKGAKP